MDNSYKQFTDLRGNEVLEEPLQWRPVEGFAYRLAREADSSLGLAIVKPVNFRSRTFVVRVGHEIVSRYEPTLEEGMRRAQAHVNQQLLQRLYRQSKAR